MACDANMCPEDFEQSFWFQRETNACGGPERSIHVQVERPKDVWIERTYDHVVASGSLKGKISQVEVVEDSESRPRNAVSFVGERGQAMQEWNEQTLPKVLPGYNGGRLPGRSTKEKGREEGEMRAAKKEGSRAKSSRKWLAGSQERVCMHDGDKKMMYRGQLSKVSCDAGTGHRLKMKKRRRAGEKGLRWQHRGMKSKNWRRFWNEEGWKEAPCSLRLCKMHLNYLCMNVCHKEKG